MKRITRGERNGLIILGILAIMLIGGSIAWRYHVSYKANNSRSAPALNVIEASVEKPDSLKKKKRKKTSGKKTRKHDSAKGRKGNKNRSAETTLPRDFLADTIPTGK